MSFLSRLVLFFAVATVLLSAQGSPDPACLAAGIHGRVSACHHDAHMPTAGQPDDSAEDAIELVNPSPLAFSFPIALESIVRSTQLFLPARTIAPLDQPPRAS